MTVEDYQIIPWRQTRNYNKVRLTLVERSLATTSTYLIIQLKHFCKGFGLAGKSCNSVECFSKQLVLPVGRDSEVKLNLTYDLIAMAEWLSRRTRILEVLGSNQA